MKCTNCGGALKTARENVKYDETLGVTLENVDVRRCTKCGDREVVLPHLSNLHETIASMLIRKTERLNHHEVRFLRKFLGGSSADFAKKMGTTASTVSRWENGATPMGQTAERALRMMVALGERTQDYSIERLGMIEKKKASAKPAPMRIALSRKGWTPEARV